MNHMWRVGLIWDDDQYICGGPKGLFLFCTVLRFWKGPWNCLSQPPAPFSEWSGQRENGSIVIFVDLTGMWVNDYVRWEGATKLVEGIHKL